jgi:hypothetical protein
VKYFLLCMVTKISLNVQVTHGRIFFQSTASQGWNFVSPAVQNTLQVFEYADCSEFYCGQYRDAVGCTFHYMCLWKDAACACKTTKPGKLCSKLKVRGPQANMQVNNRLLILYSKREFEDGLLVLQEALNALTYVPAQNTNYYMISEQEVLQVRYRFIYQV